LGTNARERGPAPAGRGAKWSTQVGGQPACHRQLGRWVGPRGAARHEIGAPCDARRGWTPRAPLEPPRRRLTMRSCGPPRQAPPVPTRPRTRPPAGCWRGAARPR